MKVEAICTRDFVYASPESSVCEAAKIMRELHIGGLIVARAEGAAAETRTLLPHLRT